MPFVARWFLRCGVVFGLVGMAIGIGMGMSGDFRLAPAHAHINLLGWVSMLLYGLVYRTIPEASRGRLPVAHLAASVLGLLLMAPGIALVTTGNPAGEPLAIAGSLLTIAGMTMFLVVILRATRATGHLKA